MAEPAIEPLRLAFDVDGPPEHAFDAWTRRIGQWWPVDHTVSQAPGVRVVLEPRRGGRIFEQAPGGEVHEWGVVTTWDPPRRLGYQWHIGRDRSDATDVEIRFREADGRTRVEIEHRGWERLGASGATWRDENMGGWRTLLPRFLAEAGGGGALGPVTDGAGEHEGERV